MIVFRADANPDIGSGHIMRCLSIADAARDRGAQCGFVLASSDFESVVRSAGFETKVLGTDYQHKEDELSVLLDVLEQMRAEAVVVDSYYVTDSYFRVLSNDFRTAYVDDLAQASYPVDVLINYNLFAKEQTYRRLYEHAAERYPVLLMGTRYIPLRKEFQNHPLRKPLERISHVLVLTGGADPNHIALRYLRHLAERTEPLPYHFHFVLGAMNSDADEMKRFAAGRDEFALHERVSRMYELMTQCDAAISASGSTVYELCASGVPIISYVLADNQVEIAQELCRRRISLYAGDIRSDRDILETFDRLLEELDGNLEKRQDMLDKARGLSDGDGAGRIADALLKMMNER